jgi:formiminoglutamase
MKNDQRHLDSIASKITSERDSKTLFLLSPSDEGVRRNQGRNGSRFAPKTILHNFLKFSDQLKDIQNINKVFVSQQHEEIDDFPKSQKDQAKRILKELSIPRDNIIHLGGGHDHVYPFLKAIDLQKKYKKILIINIDAHCDTRIDSSQHSGTPFRDFDTTTETDTELIQYGIHKFANSNSTLTNLKNIKQKIFFTGENFDYDFSSLPKDTFILLSLDADGLDSSIMKAVSAVNPYGISQNETLSIIDDIKSTGFDCAFGIYEYNPLFDDLSNQGAKVLSHLIYNWLDS